ncbi:MAG TPA: hypothetical protein VN324_07925 [Quisquiliibacterium sp.]|jgi:hypothetical protein|nr:hypothetical protein [Quisquiliibacterium sp.]
MKKTMRATCLAAAGVLTLAACASTPSQPNPQAMTFFVTSVGPGKGADLGGLAGADRHCASLAKAAGAGEREWRAYLSTQGSGLTDPNFVNARDRIGAGPWQNAMGVVIAKSVDDLHSPGNNLTKETALDERGRRLKDRTVTPNEHDILTGSRPDGTAFPGAPFPDMTCGNWTKGGTEGSAMTGHFDRAGPIAAPWATSWNSSHPTRGCHPEGIRSTGGAGHFYCFAAK